MARLLHEYWQLSKAERELFRSAIGIKDDEEGEGKAQARLIRSAAARIDALLQRSSQDRVEHAMAAARLPPVLAPVLSCYVTNGTVDKDEHYYSWREGGSCYECTIRTEDVTVEIVCGFSWADSDATAVYDFSQHPSIPRRAGYAIKQIRCKDRKGSWSTK
jgi:hypothetical protein